MFYYYSSEIFGHKKVPSQKCLVGPREWGPQFAFNPITSNRNRAVLLAGIASPRRRRRR